MRTETQQILFRLFSFGRSDLRKTHFLSPQGLMLFERCGFPIDLDDCTCLPTGGVALFNKAFGPIPAETQWYEPAQHITRADLPVSFEGYVGTKGYFCDARRPDPDTYLFTALIVGEQEVQYAAFRRRRVIFRRLGHAVELDLSDLPHHQTFSLALEWDVHYIEVRVTWLERNVPGCGSGWGLASPQDMDTYQPAQNAPAFRRSARKNFDLALVPVSLSRAIWSAAFETLEETAEEPAAGSATLRRLYRDEEDFSTTVLEVIEQVRDMLSKVRPHAFWNGEVPKSEPESGHVLRGFFELLCSSKNMSVSQEDPSRSGEGDFVFTGTCHDHSHVQLVLELKNAHSDRLERGLTHQLPKYLEERRVRRGVYAVLWFKGRTFDRPHDVDAAACLNRLMELKPPSVCAIVMLDASFPVQASRL